MGKNYKLNYRFCFLLFYVAWMSITNTVKAQLSGNNIIKQQDIVFFGGDSLNGFPLENAFNKYKQLANSAGALYEYKYILKQKEALFVKKKYNINKLSYEIGQEKDFKQNAKQIITPKEALVYRQNNPPTTLVSSCNNLDFENSNFTNWVGYEGYNEGTNNPLVTTVGPLGPPPTNLNSAETSCQYFSIIANGSTDPNMGIVLTSPLGGNCARMGGENRNLATANGGCAGGNGGTFNYTVPTQCVADYFGANIGDQVQLGGAPGEVLETTFIVTAQNSAFQYAYLFAYEDNGAHDTTQQPYFKVRVLDQNGQEINCLNYFQQGLGNACGSTHAPPGYSGSLASGLFYTSNWQVSSLNLLPYLGQSVTVRFTVAGCTVGGHMGYSYVDCSCAPQQIIIPFTACIGANTTLIAPPLGGAVYQWITPDGNIVSGATSSTVTVNQSGTYSVTITPTKTSINSSGGLVTQTLTSCSYELDTTITLYPNPIVSVNSATVCNGGSVTLTVNSTGSAGALTYTWSPPPPLTLAPGDSVASGTPPPSNANYTVTGVSVHGCKDTGVAHITVNAVPPPTFTAPAVCLGSPTIFSNATAAGNLYNWDFGDLTTTTDVSTQPNPTYTYPTAGNYAVNFTVTAVGGCTSNTTQTVTVNAMPTVQFTLNDVCDGTAVDFTNTTATQGSFSNWHWDFGDGSTNNTVSPPAHLYSGPGCYSVALTATTTTGCVGSFDTVVQVHANPVAYFSLFEACLGTPSEFIDGSSIQNPPCLNDHISSWHLDFGDGQIGTYINTVPDTIMHTYANCGGYNISMTAISSFGCIDATIFTGDSVFCLPVVTAPPSFSICPGMATSSQTFTSTVNNGGPAYTIWFTNYPVTNTGMTINDTLGYDVFPSYNTIPKNLSCGTLSDMIYGVAASNYCLGNIDSLQVTVYPTPFLSHMNNIQVCANQPVVVPAFTVCPAGDTITWTNNNTSIGLSASGMNNIPTPFNGTNVTTQVETSLITAHAEANTCIGPDSTFTIIVSPLPTITVANPGVYCPGDNVPSPAIVITPTTSIYNWTSTNNIAIGMPVSGTGLPAPYTAPTNNSLAAQTGVVTYTPTLNGCLGAPASETITINPTPVVTQMPDGFYCPGNVVPQINFTCTPSGGTPIFSYAGLGGIGIIQTGSIPTFTAINNSNTLSAVNTITVSATLNNCKGPPINFSITVFPTPIANFSYTPVCDGLPVNFTDASTAGGGFAVNSWQWIEAGNIFSTTQNPSHFITTTGTPISLLIHTSSIPSCSATATESVVIYPKPKGDFVGIDLKGCSPVNTSFTYIPGAGNATIASWNWSFGNGQSFNAPAPGGQFPKSQNYTNASSSTPKYYTTSLILTSDNGCKDTIVKTNYIEVYPTPIADFSWGPGNADLYDPNITFVNHAIGASTYTPTLTYGIYGVEYYLGDDIYATSSNPNYVFNNSSFFHSFNNPDVNDVVLTYPVTQWVINSFGCIDSITKPVEIQPIFTFYIPNAFTPNRDGTNEGFKGTGIGIKEGTYNLWVFDRWGLMIYHAEDLEKAWNGHMRGNEDKPLLQEDVYVWKVRFNDVFGKQHDYHGTVTLVR